MTLILTPTQRRLLTAVVAGRKPPEIQRDLDITTSNYGQMLHRAKIANKFQTTSQLVAAFAVESGAEDGK